MNQDLYHILVQEKMMRSTRAFFDSQDFHEIIPPILNSAIPNEPNLYPFETIWDKELLGCHFEQSREVVPSCISPLDSARGKLARNDTFYLPTSPERALKIALSKGVGNCYAIGHSFRNLEGLGSLHSPEFLMLEWYRVGADYRDIMKDVEEYVSSINKSIHEDSQRGFLDTPAVSLRAKSRSGGLARNDTPQRDRLKYLSSRPVYLELVEREGSLTNIIESDFSTPDILSGSRNDKWKTISIKDLLEDKLHINYEELITNDNSLIDCAVRLGYTTRGATWRQLFDQIMVNEVESQLPSGPVFLVDFPSRISPLCKTRDDAPHIAERFELYIDGVEIANGNNENLDADSIRTVFEKESAITGVPVDTDFLDAIQAMKDSGNHFAGVGLGIERLMKVLTDGK